MDLDERRDDLMMALRNYNGHVLDDRRFFRWVFTQHRMLEGQRMDSEDVRAVILETAGAQWATELGSMYDTLLEAFDFLDEDRIWDSFA